MANINKILFGDQKEFVYFAPGAVRIAEKASVPVKNRSHKIEATINLKGEEEGVIVSCGGMTGGYAMYISTYSLAETFDVGIDNGTQVDPDYAGSPFPFTGELDRVTITLTD